MNTLSELEPMTVARATSHEHNEEDNQAATPRAQISAAPLSPAPRAVTAPVQNSSLGLTVADLAELGALPARDEERVKELVACMRRIHRAKSKRKAAIECAREYQGANGFSFENLRRFYRKWVAAECNWRVLIDKSRSPQLRDSVSDEERNATFEFRQFWFWLCSKHKRSRSQARDHLLRIWRTGRDDNGKKLAVPGYGFWQDWFHVAHPGMPLPLEAPLPVGWNKSSLDRLKPTGHRVQKLLSREGLAAARALLPCNHRTRVGEKFMGEITFDDVKLDFRVVHDQDGKIQICDLWLLIAQDRATGLVLSYWLLPAVAREDGTQTHLGLNEMKMLCGWLLDKWGLPPYVCQWKLERGTATLGKAIAIAISELFSGRIEVSYNTMIGGTAPSGYAEKRKGNSQAKAAHEAMNNLLHNLCDAAPGQTGNLYTRRPAELWGRERHALLWVKEFEKAESENRKAENLIQRAQWPVLTLDEARDLLNRTFNRMNARTAHQMEGFDWVYEWRANPQSEWQPMATCPSNDVEKRKRKHAPIERASQLSAGLEMTRVPAAIIARFFESTQKIVPISDKGEIRFSVQDRDYIFRPRAEQHLQAPFLPGKKFLAHWNPQTQDVLHLSQLPPHRGYVDSWARYNLIGPDDTAALEESIRYTKTVQKQQTDYAARLASDEPERIAEIDAHNTALLEDLHAIDTLPKSELARTMETVDDSVRRFGKRRTPAPAPMPPVCSNAVSALQPPTDEEWQAKQDKLARRAARTQELSQQTT